MDAQTAPREITLARVGGIALPVVLSNATVPLQGAIDTAIVGNLGEAHLIAAVGIGATVISLMFGGLNFLQIGCSGLTAQALGAGRPERVLNTLLRTFFIAGVIAALLVLLKVPLRNLGLALFEGSEAAEAEAATYIDIRLWAAPAELGILTLVGWFAGQEMTRRLFEMQLVTSVANIALNVLLVFGLGMEVDGVALGTAIAVWTGFGYGLWRVMERRRAIAPPGWFADWGRILSREELVRVMSLNRDIFIRTILLIGSITWMARLGSLQGDVILAANSVLMQFLHVATNALDGFAMAAETLVGQALGARSRARLRRAVVVSTVAAFGLAAAFSLIATLGAGPVIRLLTNVEEVRAAALTYYGWATMAPLAGVLAFQLDGVFVGATEARRMRNAMVLSAAVYFPASWLMAEHWGNHGIWAALIGLYALRAATLAVAYPALERRV